MEHIFATDDGLFVALCHRLPPGLVLHYGSIMDLCSLLYASELASVDQAVKCRRNEFSTGRWLARQALVEIGVAAQPIPVATTREPIWPAGTIGSVTHSESRCAVIVGLGCDHSSVGIDLETTAVPESIADSIIGPSEPRSHSALPLLQLIFSAKESVFKCLYPLYRTFLDFHDIAITLDRNGKAFSASFVSLACPKTNIAHGIGLYEMGAGTVLTLFLIPNDQSPSHV